MTKTFYDIPIEILGDIIYFCDNKSIMNLTKVSRTLYAVTKKRREHIKTFLIDYYLSYNNKKKKNYNTNYVITQYIKNNNLDHLDMLLHLGVINPSQNLWSHLGMSIFENDYLTPIDYAVKMYNNDFIRLLLKHGCNINKSNPKYITPLMNCVGNIHTTYGLNTLVFLLKNGADPNIKNKNGYIAMDYINSRYLKSDIKEILREYGSQEGTIDVYYSTYTSDQDSDNSEYEDTDTEQEIYYYDMYENTDDSD